jgi:hypothetical protein
MTEIDSNSEGFFIGALPGDKKTPLATLGSSIFLAEKVNGSLSQRLNST